MQSLRWRWQEPADQASDQMLQLQLDNLELRFQMIDLNSLPTAQEKDRYNQIASVFADGHADDPAKALTWDDAYRLETEIGSLLHGDRLREEIASQLRSAISDQVPQAIDLQTQFATLTKDIKASDEVLRDFFLDVMETIHWSSKRKYIARKVRAQAARRTLCLALIALLVAVAPYFILSSGDQTNARPASFAYLENSDLLAIPFFTSASWIHFAFYTSLTFGFLGALFSRLITLQNQWSAMSLDELYNARTYHYIVLRASIGIVGVMVVYFFLQSGLVSGSVFPHFDKLSMNTVVFNDPDGSKWPTKLVLPSADLALLIMWSFVAGFSESLVPSVLSNAERQFGGALSTRPQ